MESETTLNIRCSYDLKRRVKQIADIYNLSRSEIIRQSLELYTKTMNLGVVK